MHRAPFGKVAGQRSPLTATAQQVQHRAEHFVQVYRSGFGLAPYRFEHRQNHGKLFATDITGVLFTAYPRIFNQILWIVNTF